MARPTLSGVSIKQEQEAIDVRHKPKLVLFPLRYAPGCETQQGTSLVTNPIPKTTDLLPTGKEITQILLLNCIKHQSTKLRHC